ncbi:MAG: c-type cytochrome [Verrucomicrobiota bacterium]
MLHARVTRVALVFGGLAAGAVLLFAALANRAPAPAPAPAPAGPAAPERSGAELFTQHCGRCHEPRELAPSLRRKPDRAQARQEAIGFLRDHGDSTDDEDVRIVDFLLQPAGR